jgi:acylphosphatase
LDGMKLKARIKGEKVHDVGYRVFLLDLALELGIERFAAYNRTDGGSEVVSVMAEGEDDQIATFRELIARERPGDAEVSDVTIEEYDGRIASTTDFMHIIQVQQLNKGIPAILRIQTTQEKMLEKQCMMLDKQDQMLDKQDTSISILKNIKEDTSEMVAIKEEVSTARYEARREREEIISILKSGSLEEKYEELSREIAEIKASIEDLRARGA